MTFQSLSVFIVIGLTNWYIAVFLPIIIMMMFCLFKTTMPAYRQCTRIESITKSPLLNLLGESISGCSTIRAFGKQSEFIDKNYELLNRNILANQILMGTWSWFGVRMNMLSIVVMASSTVVCMIYRSKEDPVLLAMVLSYILQLQAYLTNCLFNCGDFEKSMVSVQRCF